MMKRVRPDLRVTKQALSVLGKPIRVGRPERGLTAAELAERAGRDHERASDLTSR